MSRLVRSPQSSSSAEALSESIRNRWSFLSSSSVNYGSFTGILRIQTENLLLSPSGVLRFQRVRIPTILPQSG
jgi:hypothetical protein